MSKQRLRLTSREVLRNYLEELRGYAEAGCSEDAHDMMEDILRAYFAIPDLPPECEGCEYSYEVGSGHEIPPHTCGLERGDCADCGHPKAWHDEGKCGAMRGTGFERTFCECTTTH